MALDDSSSPSHSKWPNTKDQYELKEVIGTGATSIVQVAQCLTNGQKVAVKRIDLEQCGSTIEELQKEISLMISCNHQNVTRYYTSFVVQHELWIVVQLMSQGSLLDVLKRLTAKGNKGGVLDEVVIATILREALQGLEYLHTHGLIHRDVKAGNVLLGEDGSVQIADFGVSTWLCDPSSQGGGGGHHPMLGKYTRTTFVGTPCWMAPEVMDQSVPYNEKADIWSFGITALEMATGSAPYAKFTAMKVLILTLDNPPPTLEFCGELNGEDYKKYYSSKFQKMIEKCLQKDPNNRPTATELLKHPFFKRGKDKAFLKEALLSDKATLATPSFPGRRVPGTSGRLVKADDGGWVWSDDEVVEEDESHEHVAESRKVYQLSIPSSGKTQGAGVTVTPGVDDEVSLSVPAAPTVPVVSTGSGAPVTPSDPATPSASVAPGARATPVASPPLTTSQVSSNMPPPANVPYSSNMPPPANVPYSPAMPNVSTTMPPAADVQPTSVSLSPPAPYPQPAQQPSLGAAPSLSSVSLSLPQQQHVSPSVPSMSNILPSLSLPMAVTPGSLPLLYGGVVQGISVANPMPNPPAMGAMMPNPPAMGAMMPNPPAMGAMMTPAMMIPPKVALQTQQQLSIQQMVLLENQIAFQRQQQEQMIYIQQHNPAEFTVERQQYYISCLEILQILERQKQQLQFQLQDIALSLEQARAHQTMELRLQAINLQVQQQVSAHQQAQLVPTPQHLAQQVPTPQHLAQQVPTPQQHLVQPVPTPQSVQQGVTQRAIKMALRNRNKQNQLKDIKFDFVVGKDTPQGVASELVAAELVSAADMVTVGANIWKLSENPSLEKVVFQLANAVPGTADDKKLIGYAQISVVQ